jgi:hypothetical protein
LKGRVHVALPAKLASTLEFKRPMRADFCNLVNF